MKNIFRGGKSRRKKDTGASSSSDRGKSTGGAPSGGGGGASSGAAAAAAAAAAPVATNYNTNSNNAPVLTAGGSDQAGRATMPMSTTQSPGMQLQQPQNVHPPDVRPFNDGPATAPQIQAQEPAVQPPSNISHTLQANLDLQAEAERNAVTRELVKKFVADIWNRGDLELIPSVCSRPLRFNGSVGMDRVGHDGFARMVTTIRDSLNDYHCEIHSMVVEGNKAFCRMRFTGRHTGPLLGYSPTGRQVAWMGAAEFTCKDGLIVKVWELGDVKSLEEQLSGA